MQKTLIFSHRGANREASENTREAFDKSLVYAIDGMETDIQLSRDEVPVLWHDRYTDKLGRPGKHIDDFLMAELDALRFIHPETLADPSLPDAGRIMRLDSFLAAYRDHSRLLLEIKNRDWESRSRHELKVDKVLEMIDPLGNDQITVSSFNLPSLVYAHSRNEHIPVVLNLEENQTLDDSRLLLAQHSFLRGLCLPIEILDERWIELLDGQQKMIAVYTCNTEPEIRKALELHVDILISDVPQYAIQLRDG
jgi:glycerophosphoryl diester phosphodiesterase